MDDKKEITDFWNHVKVPPEGQFVLVGMPSKAKIPESIKTSKNKDFLVHTAELKRAPYYSSLKIYNHKKEEVWPSTKGGILLIPISMGWKRLIFFVTNIMDVNLN